MFGNHCIRQTNDSHWVLEQFATVRNARFMSTSRYLLTTSLQWHIICKHYLWFVPPLFPFNSSALLVLRQERHPVCKKLSIVWLVDGDRFSGASHISQLQFSRNGSSESQNGNILVPAYQAALNNGS